MGICKLTTFIRRSGTFDEMDTTKPNTHKEADREDTEEREFVMEREYEMRSIN